MRSQVVEGFITPKGATDATNSESAWPKRAAIGYRIKLHVILPGPPRKPSPNDYEVQEIEDGYFAGRADNGFGHTHYPFSQFAEEIKVVNNNGAAYLEISPGGLPRYLAAIEKYNKTSDQNITEFMGALETIRSEKEASS